MQCHTKKNIVNVVIKVETLAVQNVVTPKWTVVALQHEQLFQHCHWLQERDY